MAAPLTIPTIFTAIDKFSGVMKGMGQSVANFASSAAQGINKADKAFNSLFAPVSGAAKQLLSFATAAGLAAAIVSGIYFSSDSLIQYEKAVASFRTIVSDLSDSAFKPFQQQINQVAKDARKSSIEVAQSFEMIAGLNAEFASTAQGLGAVSAASITLSKASGQTLADSASNLVGIMNQFNLSAAEANRTINVLAAGQAVGAANISQTSEAFVNFGSVAKGANITLEQSVGLIQTLGKYSLFGAEAGTKLRGSVLKLQQAGLGYKSGQFQINDALADAQSKMVKLTSAKAKDAYLTKVFGAENITAGRILLSNVELYKQFTNSVTGTTEAQKAAAINSNTLSTRIDELKAAWVNMLTSNEQANAGMGIAKNLMKALADNLQTIVTVAGFAIAAFITWKAAVLAITIATTAFSVAQGISAALGLTQSIAFVDCAAALSAYNIVTALAAAKTWLFNAALTANPIGLVCLAIAALIALVVVVINKWNEWGAALSIVMGPLGFIISLVQSFRRNWEMITKAFHEGGMLEGLKAIGKTILDAVLMPLQQVLKIISAVTGADWAAKAMADVEQFRAQMGVNVTTDENGQPLAATPALNPKAAEQDALTQRIENSTSKNVTVDFKNLPQGSTVTDGTQSRIMPGVSSTFAF